MGLRQTFSNPFYFLLVVAGLVFCITACAYGVMTIRALQVDLAEAAPASESFMQWIDDNGFRLMMIELAFLGLFCLLAMATDGYWEQRAAERLQRKGEQL